MSSAKDIVEVSYNKRANNSFLLTDDLQAAVAKGQVVIFSKTWCPYSKKAKDLISREYPDAELTVFEFVTLLRCHGVIYVDVIMQARRKGGWSRSPGIFA